MYVLIRNNLREFSDLHPLFQKTIPPIALLLAVFAALRLAKYNTDSKQHDSFIGLPTPAMAIFVASIPLINYFYKWEYRSFGADNLVIVTIVLSALMVIPIHLFSLKFPNLTWRDNKFRYIFILLSVALFAYLNFLAVPIIIALYIALSITESLLSF